MTFKEVVKSIPASFVVNLLWARACYRKLLHVLKYEWFMNYRIRSSYWSILWEKRKNDMFVREFGLAVILVMSRLINSLFILKNFNLLF